MISEAYNFVINELEKRTLRYEVHIFDSGAYIVDIWVDNKFITVQLEKSGLGLSFHGVEEFSSMADEVFSNVAEFKSSFLSVID